MLNGQNSSESKRQRPWNSMWLPTRSCWEFRRTSWRSLRSSGRTTKTAWIMLPLPSWSSILSRILSKITMTKNMNLYMVASNYLLKSTSTEMEVWNGKNSCSTSWMLSRAINSKATRGTSTVLKMGAEQCTRILSKIRLLRSELQTSWDLRSIRRPLIVKSTRIRSIKWSYAGSSQNWHQSFRVHQAWWQKRL